MTHKEMDSARDRGEVTPLAAGVTWIARYRDAWWVAYEGGWLLAADEPLRASLDRLASRLDAAGSATIRLSILRKSLSILGAPGEAGGQPRERQLQRTEAGLQPREEGLPLAGMRRAA